MAPSGSGLDRSQGGLLSNVASAQAFSDYLVLTRPPGLLSHNPASAQAVSRFLVLRDLDEESSRDRQQIRGRYADLVLCEIPGNRRQNPRDPQRFRATDLPFAFRCLELLGILDRFLSRSRGVRPPLKATPQKVLRILRAPRRLGLLAALPLARSRPAGPLPRAHPGVRMKPPTADPTRTPLAHTPWCPSTPRPASIASRQPVPTPSPNTAWSSSR